MDRKPLPTANATPEAAGTSDCSARSFQTLPACCLARRGTAAKPLPGSGLAEQSHAIIEGSAELGGMFTLILTVPSRDCRVPPTFHPH